MREPEYDEAGLPINKPTVKPPVYKPGSHISDENKKALVDEMNDRRAHALTDVHALKTNDAWIVQEKIWGKLNVKGRKSAIYGMVMADGAVKVPVILKYFGIKKEDFEPYKTLHEMACAALALKVQRNQMSIFFSREDVIDGKYFLGRQFAEQVQNPAHDSSPSVDENSKSTTIVFTESAGLAPDKRAEFESAIQSAMAAGKVKRLR